MKQSRFFILFLGSFLLSSCKMLIDSINKDTEGQTNIKSKYNSDNKIYTTNRQFFFKSLLLNSKGDTLAKDYLVLKVLPGHWFKQTRIKWEYYKSEHDTIYHKEVTGMTDDSDGLWIHPPREGHYHLITEAMPFPEIRLPIKKIERRNTGSFYISAGWPDELKGRYDIYTSYLGEEIISTKMGALSTTKLKLEQIKSNNPSKFSTAIVYYNEKYGFVKMDGEAIDKSQFHFILDKTVD